MPQHPQAKPRTQVKGGKVVSGGVAGSLALGVTQLFPPELQPYALVALTGIFTAILNYAKHRWLK